LDLNILSVAYSQPFINPYITSQNKADYPIVPVHKSVPRKRRSRKSDYMI